MPDNENHPVAVLIKGFNERRGEKERRAQELASQHQRAQDVMAALRSQWSGVKDSTLIPAGRRIKEIAEGADSDILFDQVTDLPFGDTDLKYRFFWRGRPDDVAHLYFFLTPDGRAGACFDNPSRPLAPPGVIDVDKLDDAWAQKAFEAAFRHVFERLTP